MVMQAPVLLRLAFHDAATHEVSAGDGGANASVQYEFGRPENTGLKRGWCEADPQNYPDSVQIQTWCSGQSIDSRPSVCSVGKAWLFLH